MSIPKKAVVKNREDLIAQIGVLAKRGNLVIAKVQLHNLPQINFQFGKEVGNALLRRISDILTTLEPADLVARISPALYAVVSLDWQNPGNLLNGISDAVEKLDQSREFPFLVDMSIGATVTRTDPDRTVQSWFDEANLAMLYSGRSGKAHVFQPATALQMAIRDVFGRLSSDSQPPAGMRWVYQPINRIDDGTVFAYEALCRWSLPEYGEVGPDVFIPIAEEMGMVELIDCWGLETTHDRFDNRQSSEAPEFLSFNISAKSIETDASFERVLKAMLRQASQPGRKLIIEITETAFAEDKGRLIRQLRELRSNGILVAIDDFGTGHTALANVGDLPCDFLKVDGSLLHLQSPELALGLLQVSKSLAQLLGAKMILEGIETQADLDLAKLAGAEYGQGWLFGKALD